MTYMLIGVEQNLNLILICISMLATEVKLVFFVFTGNLFYFFQSYLFTSLAHLLDVFLSLSLCICTWFVFTCVCMCVCESSCAQRLENVGCPDASLSALFS